MRASFKNYLSRKVIGKIFYYKLKQNEIQMINRYILKRLWLILLS